MEKAIIFIVYHFQQRLIFSTGITGINSVKTSETKYCAVDKLKPSADSHIMENKRPTWKLSSANEHFGRNTELKFDTSNISKNTFWGPVLLCAFFGGQSHTMYIMFRKIIFFSLMGPQIDPELM